MQLIVCRKCKTHKPLSEYTPNRWTKSGHTSQCKACALSYSHQWRRENPDKAAASDKRRLERLKLQRYSKPSRYPERITAEGRLCNRCEFRKDPSEFGKYTGNPDGISNRCKPCMREAARESRYSQLEVARARERLKGKKQYDKNREKILVRRASGRLKYRYGLTRDLLEEMFLDQEGKCAICQSEVVLPNGEGKSIGTANIDHCHKTGRVRGLICTFCNHGLGSFRDNPEALESAIRYLKEHSK